MKFSLIFLVICVLALLTGCAVSPAKLNVSDLPGARPPRADELDARMRWELEMLRDPKSGVIPPAIHRLERQFASTLPRVRDDRGIHSLASIGANALNWTSRGPNNISGRTRALAIDLSDASGNTILAGGVSGGIWRTTNGGAAWTRQFALTQLPSVTCIAQDRRNGKQNIWYAGTGERLGNSASGDGATFLGDGIYKSIDSGVTWSLLQATVSGTPQTYDKEFDFVWKVVTDRNNAIEDVVYAAVVGGIMRSSDGGTTWTIVLGDGLTGAPTDVEITSTGVIYATFGSNASLTKGVYRSTTGLANSWTDITPALPANYGRLVLAIAPSSENVVYLLGNTPGGGLNDHSFWKYDATIGSWTNRSANLPVNSATSQTFNSQGGYDLLVAVKPDNPDVVFIGGTSLYRSTDGFASAGNTIHIGGYRAEQANNADYLNHHPDQQAITFLAGTPLTMLSAGDGGVFKTTDDTAVLVVWTPLNNGYVTTQYYSVAIDQATAGNSIITGGLQDRGNFFTANNSWSEITGGDGTVAAIANGRAFYLNETQNGNLARLAISDTGTVMSQLRIDPETATGKAFVNPYVLDPNNTNIAYYAGGDYIWRSNDIPNASPTTGWTRVDSSLVAGTRVSTIAVARSTANRLYYGTANGKVFRIDGADTGVSPTVTDIWTGKGLPVNANVNGIAIDPTNADSLLLVFSNYSVISVYYSSNGGGTWTAISGNLEQFPDGTGTGPSVRTAAILPVTGQTLFLVGTSIGVYSTSTLNGNNTVWAQQASNVIGNAVVTQLVTRPADGLVVAGTHGFGVFSATFSAAVIAPPTGVSATAATATSVTVSWTAAAGATSYRVYRSGNNVAYTQVGAPVSSPFTDNTAVAATAYLYRVRSFDGTAESADSGRDLATTVLFTDPTLTARTTTIKAAHLTELRTAVNAVRALAGVGGGTFTDGTLDSATRIKRLHVTDLRTALDQARTPLNLPAINYTDGNLPAGTLVMKAHIDELRSGVQ